MAINQNIPLYGLRSK